MDLKEREINKEYLNRINEYLNKYTDYLITKKIKLEEVYAKESDELDKFFINNNILILIAKRGMSVTLDLDKLIVYKEGEEFIICSNNVYISIQPISKKYPNLRAEIERHDLSYRLINTVIEQEGTNIQDILMGNKEINIREAMSLRNELFPNLTMDYLFT